MRVTTNMIYQNSLNGILDNQKKLLRSQDELVEGTKILQPSDDPTGATKVVRFEEDLARLEQFDKNTILLQNTLQNKETALTNFNDSVLRARNLTMQAGDGAFSYSDRKSIAAELTLVRDELQDLMNSKDSQGNYLFSGGKSDTPAFMRDATGTFVYQGDQHVNKIQVSETLEIEDGVPGAGFSIFENTQATSTVTINPASTATGKYQLKVIDQFEGFHDQNYLAVPPAPAGSNDYNINILAGNNYEIRDNGGTLLESGPFDASGTDDIMFKGLEFGVTGGPGDQLNFTLDPPNKSNVLNVLDDLINTLNTTETPTEAMQQKLQSSIYSFDQTQINVGNARSEIGGRDNVVDSVILSNIDLSINIKESKAKVAEVDYAEAISNLQQHETALTAAQQIYPKVTGLSLMNFIR